MEICIIHGSNRKGNTERTIEIIKDKLNTLDKIIYSDIYLSKDLPVFCDGCFLCMDKGDYAGQICPHKQYTHPILEKMLRSDGIIIASPSYALAETAQVKALFDHLACSFMNHRPNSEMFNKIGLIVSTAAGAGTGGVVNTVRKNMLFWGMIRTIKCQINMWAKEWDKMQIKKRNNVEKLLQKKANKFYTYIKKRNKLRRNINTIFLWFIFKKLIKSYSDDAPDKIYWKSKGWI